MESSVKGILMKSGRFLSYEEYGETTSPKVIIFFHSLGSCRKEKHPNDNIIKKFGFRMINIDRPGYGKSEIDENRNYISFADDVIELLDCFKINFFSICGLNSGCPYMLSLCSKYPDRVISCALLSPELPYSILPHDEFSSHLKDTWFLTKYFPFLLRFFLYNDLYKTVFSEPQSYTSLVIRDSEKLYPFEGEELKIYLQNCIPNLREGMEIYGVKEVVRELILERSEWKFDWFSNPTKIPIYIYHGKKNQLIPIKLVRRFQKKIEFSHLIEVEDKGHFFWLNEEWWTDILSSLSKHFND